MASISSSVRGKLGLDWVCGFCQLSLPVSAGAPRDKILTNQNKIFSPPQPSHVSSNLLPSSNGGAGRVSCLRGGVRCDWDSGWFYQFPEWWGLRSCSIITFYENSPLMNFEFVKADDTSCILSWAELRGDARRGNVPRLLWLFSSVWKYPGKMAYWEIPGRFLWLFSDGFWINDQV